MNSSLTKKKFKLTQPMIILIIIILVSIAVTIANDRFMTSRNLLNILQQVSIVGIVTLGATILIASGGLDLSVGTMISFLACSLAQFIMDGMNQILACTIILVVGIFCGLINGVIISKSRAAPFIVTIGMMSVYQGLAHIVTKGVSMPLEGKFSFAVIRLWGVPMPVIIFLLLTVIVMILMKYSKFGRRVYAVGSNEEAAFLSAINVTRHKISVYAINGALAAIASMVVLSRLAHATALMGSGYELQALAACVIGGASLAGGKGTVVGSFLGIVLLGLVTNALSIAGVAFYYSAMVLGVIIVIAVVISALNDRKA